MCSFYTRNKSSIANNAHGVDHALILYKILAADKF